MTWLDARPIAERVAPPIVGSSHPVNVIVTSHVHALRRLTALSCIAKANESLVPPAWAGSSYSTRKHSPQSSSMAPFATKIKRGIVNAWLAHVRLPQLDTSLVIRTT